MDIWKFASIALLAVVLSQTMGLGWNDAAREFGVENESIELSNSGAAVDVLDVREYGVEVSVRYNGTQLAEGTDYAWNETSGTLERLANSSAPDGADVSISYDYAAPSDSTEASNDVLSASVGLLPYLLLFVGALVTAKLLSAASGGR